MDQMIAGEIRDLRQTLAAANKRIAELEEALLDAVADRVEAKNDGAVLRGRITELEAENKQLAQERDLALAHDTQPYPTAWAYEQVCKALEAHKAKLAKCTEAVQDALAQAQGDWDAVDRHPASIHADAVAYYQKVLKEAALADPPAEAEKEKKGESDG